jgi:hypothetical protein
MASVEVKIDVAGCDSRMKFGHARSLCEIARENAAKLADGCVIVGIDPRDAVARVGDAFDVWIGGVCYRQVNFDLPADFFSCGLDALTAGYEPAGTSHWRRSELRPMAELVELDQAEPAAEDEGDRLMRLIRDAAGG